MGLASAVKWDAPPSCAQAGASRRLGTGQQMRGGLARKSPARPARWMRGWRGRGLLAWRTCLTRKIKSAAAAGRARPGCNCHEVAIILARVGTQGAALALPAGAAGNNRANWHAGVAGRAKADAARASPWPDLLRVVRVGHRHGAPRSGWPGGTRRRTTWQCRLARGGAVLL